MGKEHWIPLSSRERTLLLKALSSLRPSMQISVAEVDALFFKLSGTEPHPIITIGVHGGQVQWTEGNPFPIRIRDYDGEASELPDLDERGQSCRTWTEPPNIKIETT